VLSSPQLLPTILAGNSFAGMWACEQTGVDFLKALLGIPALTELLLGSGIMETILVTAHRLLVSSLKQQPCL